MTKDLDATKVLERFAPQIRWVTDSVMESFDLEPHFKDDIRQEAEIQVMAYAGLLDEHVWMFGALSKWETQAKGDEGQVKALLGRQLRIALAQITSRMIHRNGEQSMHDSLDRLRDEFDREPQSGPGETYNVASPPADPIVDYDEVMLTLADPGSRYLERLVKEYPLTAMQVIGEMPLSEIRKRAGLTQGQVTYKLRLEKDDLRPVWAYEDTLFGDWLKTLDRKELTKIRRNGLREYLFVAVSEKNTDNGIVYLLIVEGDEDLEDLVEAKTNLFAVGR